MDAVVWMYAVMFSLPSGEAIRQIVLFDTLEECKEANAMYTEWLIDNKYDYKRYGIPESACIKGMKV